MSGTGKSKTKSCPPGDDKVKLSVEAGQQNKVQNSETVAANVHEKMEFRYDS